MKSQLYDKEEKYKDILGNDFGEYFAELDYQITKLHVIWQQYQQLYIDDSSVIDILNSSAGLFFKIVQDELWDSVLLAIARMTDKPQMGNADNLSLLAIPDFDFFADKRDDQLEIKRLCHIAVSDASYVKVHRNKRIAHQDKDYYLNRKIKPLEGISLKDIDITLTSFRNIMNFINAKYCDSTTLYEKFIDETGARVLVNLLKKYNSFKDSKEYNDWQKKVFDKLCPPDTYSK